MKYPLTMLLDEFTNFDEVSEFVRKRGRTAREQSKEKEPETKAKEPPKPQPKPKPQPQGQKMSEVIESDSHLEQPKSVDSKA